MGIASSLLGKLGLSGVQSAWVDSVYNRYFTDQEIREFESFHLAFLRLCSELNSIMPGRHYDPPPYDEVVKCHEKFKKVGSEKEQKDLVVSLLTDNLRASRSGTDNRAIILTGMVAPAAAMALKKTGENLPQAKKFRLNLIPDAVFVPTFTLLSLVGAKMPQLSKNNTTRKTP